MYNVVEPEGLVLAGDVERLQVQRIVLHGSTAAGPTLRGTGHAAEQLVAHRWPHNSCTDYRHVAAIKAWVSDSCSARIRSGPSCQSLRQPEGLQQVCGPVAEQTRTVAQWVLAAAQWVLAAGRGGR